MLEATTVILLQTGQYRRTVEIQELFPRYLHESFLSTSSKEYLISLG